MSSSLINLTQASFRRADKLIVQDINLSVNSGEIITLIGPNGSGKSTIAKLSLGLLKPSSGICERRHDIKVGYLPQHLPLDWTLPLSVKRLMQLTSLPSHSDILSSLSRTGTEHLLDEQVHRLSGGELQRILLARAISLKPDLLVLDEPVAGIDVGSEAKMYELIASIRDELSCGILLISHDLHIVMAKSDKVICVNRHICCEGNPASVVKDPEYLTLFNHSAPMALYGHAHDHDHNPDGTIIKEQ